MTLESNRDSVRPPWRAPRRPDSDYDWIFDSEGDEMTLTPGVDFGTVASFRVRLTRMCQARGLRYRSVVWDGKLWVQIYKIIPGDMLPPDLVGEPGNWPTDRPTAASAAAPEPSPGQ